MALAQLPVARLLLWGAHNLFFAFAKEGKPSAPAQWLPTEQKFGRKTPDQAARPFFFSIASGLGSRPRNDV